MTNPLTIQLPPNLEQQMLQEAQKHNTTLEHLVLKSLQKEYGTNQDIQDSTATIDNHLDNDDPLTQMFNRIYEANQTGQESIQAKITPLTRQIANSLVSQQLIDRIEIDGTTDTMTLYMPATPIPAPQFRRVNYLQEFPTDDPEEIQILQKLQDSDPSIRIQGVHALRDRCRELA